jgi:membrane fusion protein (multidrug efflux system)
VAEDAGGKLVAKQRAIKVGPITGDNYPVLDGLKAGDRIVTSGTMKLADGAPIQAAPSEGSTDKSQGSAGKSQGSAPAAPR